MLAGPWGHLQRAPTTGTIAARHRPPQTQDKALYLTEKTQAPRSTVNPLQAHRKGHTWTPAAKSLHQGAATKKCRKTHCSVPASPGNPWLVGGRGQGLLGWSVHGGPCRGGCECRPSEAWTNPVGSWRLQDSVPWKLTAGEAGPGAEFTREGTAAQLWGHRGPGGAQLWGVVGLRPRQVWAGRGAGQVPEGSRRPGRPPPFRQRSPLCSSVLRGPS